MPKMIPGARILLAAALLAAVVPLGAQTASSAQATPAPPATRTAPATPAAQAAPGPQVSASSPAPAAAADPNLPERRVIEDDQVRIEELRVRGMVRSVTVQSKLAGARPYEVVVGWHGRDPSIYRGAAGQSRWSLLDF
jgi:hypothetical protein